MPVRVLCVGPPPESGRFHNSHAWKNTPLAQPLLGWPGLPDRGGISEESYATPWSDNLGIRASRRSPVPLRARQRGQEPFLDICTRRGLREMSD